MSKTFKFVGVAVKNGVAVVRYTNLKGRTRVLERGGFTNVHFVELPKALPEKGCIAALLDEQFVQDTPALAEAVWTAAVNSGFETA